MPAIPYRARPDAPSASFALNPLLPMRLLVVFGVLVTFISLLHIFLWSRVVHIRCARAVDDVACEVDESSLALTDRRRVDARGAQHADLRGAVSRQRGDTWIVFVNGDVEWDLTSGLNIGKYDQRQAVDELNAFLGDKSVSSVELGFGNRWLTAWIFLVVFGALFLVSYPVFGYRVRVTIDRGQGTMTIRRGAWPLISRSSLPLQSFTGFSVENRAGTRLVANMSGQPPAPCTYRAHPGLLQDAADRLNAWARAQTDPGPP